MKTLEEKIEAIVADMENWDAETLMEWAQDARRSMLEGVSEDVVDMEYEETINPSLGVVVIIQEENTC